jgi:tetratricopeptide (TPR) repeat protein
MKRFRYRIIIAILWTTALSRAPAFSAAPQEAARFEEAAKAYQAGDFAKAREIYEGLSAEHKRDSNLCYNLGNVYYRLGEMGRAILWYERALKRRPYDIEIRDNLTFVRSGLRGDGESALEKAVGFPKISWLLGIATVCLWIGAGALALLFLRMGTASERLKKLAAVSLALWAFFAVWGGFRWWDESKPWGIVIPKEIQIRSGPGIGFAVGATAPAGLKALVLEERDGWVWVGLPKAGIKGWTQTANVERIE